MSLFNNQVSYFTVINNMNRCKILASNPNALRVLIQMIEIYELKTQYEQENLIVEMPYSELAKHLDCSKRTIARAIKMLCEHGMIAKRYTISQSDLLTERLIEKGNNINLTSEELMILEYSLQLSPFYNRYLFTSELIKRYWVDYNTFCKLNDQHMKNTNTERLTIEKFYELQEQAIAQLNSLK